VGLTRKGGREAGRRTIIDNIAETIANHSALHGANLKLLVILKFRHMYLDRSGDFLEMAGKLQAAPVCILLIFKKTVQR